MVLVGPRRRRTWQVVGVDRRSRHAGGSVARPPLGRPGPRPRRRRPRLDRGGPAPARRHRVGLRASAGGQPRSQVGRPVGRQSDRSGAAGPGGAGARRARRRLDRLGPGRRRPRWPRRRRPGRDLPGDRRRVPHGHPGPHQSLPLGRAGVRRELGRPRPAGPGLHRQRTDGRRHRRLHRRRCAAARPRVRRRLRRRGPGRGGAASRRRARAHRRLRPGGAQRRHRHRPRLGQREPGARPRVHVGRRHRDRLDAVLLPAELDVVPDGRRAGAGGRAAALRRRLRPLGGAADGPAGRWSW